MFFFHFQQAEAPAALKAALKNSGESYDSFAKRVGISRSTVDLFMRGRALTPAMLRKVLDSVPVEVGRDIMRGHMRDELYRVGVDPNTFAINSRPQFGGIYEQLARMVEVNPARLAEVVTLLDKWNQADLADRVGSAEGSEGET